MRRWPLGLLVLLAACVSSELKPFVGKSLADAIVEKGPPSFAVQLSERETAFVWNRKETYIIPGNTSVTGSAYVFGTTTLFRANSFTSPTLYGESSCNLTLVAEKNSSGLEGPAGYTVTRYIVPKQLIC